MILLNVQKLSSSNSASAWLDAKHRAAGVAGCCPRYCAIHNGSRSGTMASVRCHAIQQTNHPCHVRDNTDRKHSKSDTELRLRCIRGPERSSTASHVRKIESQLRTKVSNSLPMAQIRRSLPTGVACTAVPLFQSVIEAVFDDREPNRRAIMFNTNTSISGKEAATA